MKRIFFAIVLLAALICTPAFGDYKFSVDKNVSDVFINQDGSANIEYELTFTCAPGGKAIDIVDVGLPNRYYKPSNFQAWLNGNSLPVVQQSEYVSMGVEIPLFQYMIKPGETGTLKVKGSVVRMVYNDDDDPAYASVEFAPTFYGSSYTVGYTDLTVRIHFPKAVTSNETKYHKIKPTKMDATGDHIVFSWIFQNHSPSGTTQVGVGFPKRYVSQTFMPDKSGGLGGGRCGTMLSMIIFPWVFPFGFFVLIIIVIIRAKGRRMMKYLPPELSVEGVGIKRGLNAPEAALVREMPLNKVITMVLFGLIRKGTIEVEKTDPLKLKKLTVPEDTKIHPYEKQFLECINRQGAFSETEGKAFLIAFIKATNRKLKGFSRKETARYYANIAGEAWSMVEKAGTPEVVGRYFDTRAEWLMMDEDFERRMSKSIPHDTVVLPHWWGNFSTGHVGNVMPDSGGGFSMSLPDFANTVTDSISNFSNNIVTSVSDFTSGVTGATNPPPVSTSSYSSGGGSSCACACACAGCACACAGGGR